MLYAVLDNGDFIGLVDGSDKAPAVDYLREFGEASPAFIEFLIKEKGFNRLFYNVCDDTLASDAERPFPQQNVHDLYAVLTDDSLWTVVSGQSEVDMYGLIMEFDEQEQFGELNEYLASKGFVEIEAKVIEGIDAFSPMAYAQQNSIRVIHTIFKN